MPLSEREMLDMLTTQRFEIVKLKKTLQFKEWFIRAQGEELAMLRKKVGQKGRKGRKKNG